MILAALTESVISSCDTESPDATLDLYSASSKLPTSPSRVTLNSTAGAYPNPGLAGGRGGGDGGGDKAGGGGNWDLV